MEGRRTGLLATEYQLGSKGIGGTVFYLYYLVDKRQGYATFLWYKTA